MKVVELPDPDVSESGEPTAPDQVQESRNGDSSTSVQFGNLTQITKLQPGITTKKITTDIAY